MSSRVELIKQTEKVVGDLSIRFQTAKISLDAVEKEIAQLFSLRAQLEENLHTLKKQSLIVSAQEFKKIKEELTRIRLRSAMLSIDQKNIFVALKDIQTQFEKNKTILEKLQKTEDSVVIATNAWSKNGQE